jgi:hypothetical protein
MMETLVHKRLGTTISFDFHASTIRGALPDGSPIAFENVVCVIGYLKPGWFWPQYAIAVAFQDGHGDIAHCDVLTTNNEFEYRYFLEKTVARLRSEWGAIGGDSWCARVCNADKTLDHNDHFRAFRLCRMLADKLGSPWFEHTPTDEALVAITFIAKRLMPDGSELAQVSAAIKETGFGVQHDGSFSTFSSTGYRTLDDHRIRLLSQSGPPTEPP